MTEVEDVFYSAKEVAELLKIKKTTVYDLVKKNVLPATKVGKQLRISSEDLESYLKKNGNKIEEVKPVMLEDRTDYALWTREYLNNNTGLIVNGPEEILSLFCAYMQLNIKNIPILRDYSNYYDTWYSLYFEKIHAAFLPVFSDKDMDFVKVMLPGVPIVNIEVADVTYGIYIKNGENSDIKTLIYNSDFMIGGKGSISRIIFDLELQKNKINIEDVNVTGESISELTAIAAAASGIAEAAIGSSAYREKFPDLNFIPVKETKIKLLFNKKHMKTSVFKTIIKVIQSEEFKLRLSQTDGYDCKNTGNIG